MDPCGSPFAVIEVGFKVASIVLSRLNNNKIIS